MVQMEVNPRQSWERCERKHYRSHLQTRAALRTALTGGLQHRVASREGLPPAKLPERQHFEENSEKSETQNSVFPSS